MCKHKTSKAFDVYEEKWMQAVLTEDVCEY